jgi:hypothetical protein
MTSGAAPTVWFQQAVAPRPQGKRMGRAALVDAQPSCRGGCPAAALPPGFGR